MSAFQITTHRLDTTTTRKDIKGKGEFGKYYGSTRELMLMKAQSEERIQQQLCYNIWDYVLLLLLSGSCSSRLTAYIPNI